ncbi:P-loop containing nucleoside triphosphate hydrolase protein [Plectosphaerella plurivora]|uniref:P-loop containing nucleoside triphosphate hydrolase protein n=1 Tax=Plectosphaerella plurivora TaxID=936078 RepID=A0A9P8UZ02_9PEZI|nr:P-loop containing nucleoside triphosphate hydrolase protein [Plectosphaerella plurivora]
MESKKFRPFVYMPCVILRGDTIVAAHPSFGEGCVKLEAQLCWCRQTDRDPWIGFTIHAPREEPSAKDDSEHVHHTVLGPKLAPTHMVTIAFPRGGYTPVAKEADEDVLSKFPNGKWKTFSVLSVHIHKGEPLIMGFGAPYANDADTYLHGVVNYDRPIVDGLTLRDLCVSKNFTIVVPCGVDNLLSEMDESSLPPPFAYPYGESHGWDLEVFEKLWAETKSNVPFVPTVFYANLNSMLAAQTQAVVQDMLWLHHDAERIAADHLSAYLVPRLGHDSQYYIVVPIKQDWRDKYASAWRRLTKNDCVHIRVVKTDDKSKWPCRIMSNPDHIPERGGHHSSTSGTDMVLLPMKNVGAASAKTFHLVSLIFDSGAEEAERRVNAAMQYSSTDFPRSPTPALGFPDARSALELHRQDLCGQGFYKWLSKAAVKNESSNGGTLTKLPSINYLAIDDQVYIDALMTEILEVDRPRFRRYVSDLAVGLGIIIAGAGVGKTTVVAVAALLMQARLGKVLCSAPSNTAVDNLAERIYAVSATVVARYNADPANVIAFAEPMRRKLVIRGLKTISDISIFETLVKSPDDIDAAMPRIGGVSAKSRLPLSISHWMLAVFRSPLAHLVEDDAKVLHDMRDEIDGREDLHPLRDLVAGCIKWSDFLVHKGTQQGLFMALEKRLTEAADFACMTPALSTNDPEWLKWKNTCQGVVVDEAGAIHRTDLYDVWGNVMTPLFLCGDQNQLPPTVLTEKEVDMAGNLKNRFAADGRISGLEQLLCTGFPVFRLRTQLRMAKGLFDIIAREVYENFKVDYAPCCNIDEPRFHSGHILESLIREKFPGIESPAEGKFSPVFINCKGTKVFKNEATGSKRSADQVKVALDFAVELTQKGVPASSVVILTPYMANVDLLAGFRKRNAYAEPLEDMPQAATIDGYHGQEMDITIIVMGTNQHVGPGFTADRSRLNVLLTRSRCGLVLVGDINAAGQIDHLIKTHDAGKKPVLVEKSTGEMGYMSAEELKNLYKNL